MSLREAKKATRLKAAYSLGADANHMRAISKVGRVDSLNGGLGSESATSMKDPNPSAKARRSQHSCSSNEVEIGEKIGFARKKKVVVAMRASSPGESASIK